MKIISRWNDAVLWEGEAGSVKDAVYAAIKSGADLSGADIGGADLSGADIGGADLRGANLSDADLSGANLSDADLSGADIGDANLRGADLRWANLSEANLRGANLSEADISGANLRGADISGANLRGANLSDANLRGADLRWANLSEANLTPIRDDIWAILSAAPAEVPALLNALMEGRIDGSTYTGECACLCGTIANARKCDYQKLGALQPNSSRPAERFFLGINQGDTPETNQFSALAAQWVEEWLANMRAAFGATL